MLEKTGHTVGLDNVSINIEEGEKPAEAATEGADGEPVAEGAEATAKDGEAGKKDEKGKDGSADKKSEEKKTAEKKPAEKK